VIGLLLLIVSRCCLSFGILSRDRRAMESHLLNDLAVPLLSSLSRSTAYYSNLVPGDPGRHHSCLAT
jgi:hypothetical protein